MKWSNSENETHLLESGDYRVVDVSLDRVSYELRYKDRWLASSVSTEHLKYLAMNHACNVSITEHNKGK